MKTSLVLAAVVGLVFGAPTEHGSSEIKDTEIQRIERSYGPPPCAGAGGYGTPVSLYLAPQSPVPQDPLPQSPLPQYREDEKHEEFSHMARSYYEPALPALPATSGGYGSGAGAALAPAPSPALIAPASASSSSAVGLFPNAKVGGCNVPLLLSCSPQVVTGHLTESHYSAPAYRHMEEPKWEMRNVKPTDARIASHHKVSEDFPDPHPGNHHVVSQDYPEPHPGNHHVVSQDYPEPNLTKITKVERHNQDNKKELEKRN